MACKSAFLESGCQPMQRSVQSGRSDKAMCAPVIALDRFGIGYFARIKQFESVEIDVVEVLVLTFIRDQDLLTVNDRSSRFIQNMLIRWRIQFTREKYDTTTPDEDDTDMVGTFHIGGLCTRISTPVSDEIKASFWKLKNVGL
jgi:hypothetical protein